MCFLGALQYHADGGKYTRLPQGPSGIVWRSYILYTTSIFFFLIREERSLLPEFYHDIPVAI